MTSDEMKATIAETLYELSETKKQIACLKKRIGPFAEAFKEVGSRLAYEPEGINVRDEEGVFRFNWRETHYGGGAPKASQHEFDPVELVKYLQELKSATERLNRINVSLREMGHAHMIED